MNLISKIGKAGGAVLAKVFDSISNALHVILDNPIWEHQLSAPHLVDVTNIADTTTHYAYLDLRDYKNATIQFQFGGADTITVKTGGSDETDENITSASYTDNSTVILGAVSLTADEIIHLDTGLALAFLRIEYTSNNSASDGDLKVSVFARA